MTRRLKQLRGVVRSVRLVGILVAVVLAVGAAATRTFGANQEGPTTLGFLVATSDAGIHYGKFEEECPQGFELTLEEEYVASLTPAQREWMLRPENSFEYGNAWKNDFLSGPGGTNICSNPKSFKDDPRRRLYRGVAGKVSYGLNLDGTTDGHATPMTCAHQKFEGLNGEPLVDNQLYRVSGCSKLNRGTELPTKQYINAFLIELRGVDDLKNDDRVDVGVYSLADGEVSLKTADGAEVTHQTFTVTATPRWRVQTTARIVDGVVIVEPISVMRLNRAGGFAAGKAYYAPNSPGFVYVAEHEYRHARFRFSLNPDGTFKGVMGGYRPIDNIYLSQYGGGRGTASTANNDCASEYNTFAKFADGDPDPVTGRCTAISAAHNITGIPAFLVPPSGETLSAIRAGASVASK